MTDLSAVPFRPVDFAPLDIEWQVRPDGSMLLRSRLELSLREAHLPGYLRRHALRRPDHRWIGQRRDKGGEWRHVTFAEVLDQVNRLTQALLGLNIPTGRPLAILSANSIEHALLTLAAMQARLIVAPISVAYSQQSTDFVKLREVVEAIKPGAIFVQDGAVFARALAALDLNGIPIIAVDNPGPDHVTYGDMLATPPTAAVEASVAAIDPHAIAKIMFTSGSTGSPKGVPQTHHALVVTSESNLQTNGYIREGEIKRLDWMPWNHVFGATSLATSLVDGGTLMIDDGRPIAPLFNETLRNLREFSPTSFVSVPAAYTMLIAALEDDEALAKRFFGDLMMLGYGGASLPEDIVRRLQTLAVRHTGLKIPITCGYGATETGPGGAFIYWPTDRTGLIGLPHPGFEMKLVPIGDGRFEVRIRGAAVMKGYLGRPDLNADIFDEEGFYRIGDTVRMADSTNILEGLVFAGRLAEEFKLQSGTFVLVGGLRLRLVEALAPLVSDVVVCGENMAHIGIMAWLNVDAARKLVGRSDALRAELNDDPVIRDALVAGLQRHNQAHPAQSTRVACFTLLDEPPSIDKGEITDKGSVNQRAVQRHRPDRVSSLFAAQPPEAVIAVPSLRTAVA